MATSQVMGETEDIQKIVADILIANATKMFTTKCLACGKSQTRTLRWLQTNRFKCPVCGGALDDSPLHQLTLSALSRLRKPQRSKPRAQRMVHEKDRVRKSPPSQTKKYQLVLQFAGDALADFDAMVALENELTETFEDSAEVDGHDVGSGETNIFIFTVDPLATFNQARSVLKRRQQLQVVTAAYRETEGERYTVIWPVGSRKRFAIS
jgi:hypothetical protein